MKTRYRIGMLAFLSSTLIGMPFEADAGHVRFTKIVDSNDFVPGVDPADTFRNIQIAVLSGNTVVFSGDWTPTGAREGIFAYTPATGITTIFKDLESFGPSSASSIGFFSYDGTNIVFDAILTGGFGIGLIQQTAPETFSIVRSTQDDMPPYDMDHGFGNFLDISFNNGEIIWHSQTDFSSEETGVYTFNGGLTQIAISGDSMPGSADTFRFFSATVRDGSTIALSGINSGSSNAGIYMDNGSGLVTVVDTDTPRPGGDADETLHSLAWEIALHDDDIAFMGGFADPEFNFVHGVYSTAGTGLHTVADTLTPVPGGQGGDFHDFIYHVGIQGGLAIHSGITVFGGRERVNFQDIPGIYVEQNGNIGKVIAAGDMIDGEIVQQLRFSREGFDGKDLIFIASFDSQRIGVYRAENITRVIAPPVSAGIAADFNGNNNTDIGVLRFDNVKNRSILHVMDGGSGNEIAKINFSTGLLKDFTPVSDFDGDTIPEFGVLVDGSLFARIKNITSASLIGKPKFNDDYDPVAFLAVGEAGGSTGPDVAVVGREFDTGKVQAWVKEAASGALVERFTFPKAFVPFAAVAIDNVGDSNAMEIAVLGIDSNGKVQATVKDAQSGNVINKIGFSKKFVPLFFAAIPDASGKLTNLAVLGRSAAGTIQAQTKRVSDGFKISTIRFSKGYDPRAFLSFTDSNSSGSGEISVVGVNGSGAVRAQTKEIADGAKVNVISLNKKYPPVDAIAVNGVAGTGQNEIAVLGKHVNGDYRLQIMDLSTGDKVKVILLP